MAFAEKGEFNADGHSAPDIAPLVRAHRRERMAKVETVVRIHAKGHSCSRPIPFAKSGVVGIACFVPKADSHFMFVCLIHAELGCAA